MIKTWRGLGRSLVRRLYCRPSIGLAVLTLCSFLPAFSFGFVYDGEEYTPLYSSYVYQLLTFTSPTSYTQNSFSAYDYSPLLLYSFTPFSVVLNKYNGQFVLPNNFNHTSIKTNSSSSINFPIRAVDRNGKAFNFSVFAVPELSSMFQTVSLLYSNGYRGQGFEFTPAVSSSSSYVPILVNWRDLLADVLGGTNGVYRAILLSQSMSISEAVQSIGLNTAGLQSSIDHGNNLLSGVHSSVEQGNASLSNINLSVSGIRDVAGANLAAVSNISVSAASISSNSVDILRGVDLLHDDWLASSIDVFLGDDTEAWVNFLNIAVEQGLLSESDASQYESTLRATDPSRKKSYSIPDAHRRFFAKNSIKGTVVEAQQMRGRYQTFRNWTNQRGEMFGAMDSTWNAVAGDRINSIMGAHVDDWRQELRQQLQDWKTSDERGILNVKKTIEDNFTTPDPRAPASSNSIPFTAFQTNFVTRPLTNAVHEASKQIQSNATANVDRQLEADDNRWDEFKSIATGDGEGLNVNIRSPLWEEGGFHVNVRDDAVVSAIQNLSAAPPPELVHISDAFDSFLGKYSTTNSLDWSPWFERWDPFSGIVTNFYSEYNSSRPAVEIARGYLSTGFDFSGYEKLPWFERVEVLLAMIADVGTNSVEVADIEEDMEDQVTAFRNLSTNVVSVSSDVVGLFDYVRRFSVSLDSMFGDKAAPLTGDYVLLPAGHWIGDEALVLRVNPAIQNLCRLIMQCIWYLGFLVLLWVVVNWVWQKVVAVLRWLWSMFDV